jgi:hypothetical protein
MQHRHERIVIETSRHRITGTATLARDGYRSRLSDLLNASERDFISLTDATVEPVDGGEPSHHEYMAVHRHHVVYAVTLGPVDHPGPTLVA